MTEEKLVPVFIPALVVLLVSVEDKKGSPLSQEEVLLVRDKAAVIMSPKSESEKMAESRGYPDIDPENCWYDWQMARREMGRKPDLDPGARFFFTGSADQNMKDAVISARDSLAQFRKFISDTKKELHPLIKIKLVEPSYSANMWLMVTQNSPAGFSAKLFEIPQDFKSFKVGDELTVRDEEVLDWMINDEGTLYGGYSLRVQREQLGANEKLDFDKHIGVERYA